jgi:nucleotide-binding universal stress UspA family protein
MNQRQSPELRDQERSRCPVEATMNRHILVPLDGSEAAEAALARAQALAYLAPSTLYLLQAALPEEEDTADRYLELVAERLRGEGLVVEPLTVPGEPAEMIVWEAAHRRVDAIVMATHGRTGRGPGVLGRVADRVLHRTTCPVLLVPGHQGALDPWPRRILVPLDGSELAENALVHARALAGAGGEVLLYQAVAPAVPIDAPMAEALAAADGPEAVLADAIHYLNTVAATLHAAGYAVRTAAELGPPVEGIVSYAHRERVDLIVVSSHGRSGVARWLLGSVAGELVRLGPAPLLVVRPLQAAAERPIAAARVEGMLRGSTPLPPTTLVLNAWQSRLVRAALENLLWDVPWEEPVATELQALLAQLPITASRADNPAPAERAGSAGVEALGRFGR